MRNTLLASILVSAVAIPATVLADGQRGNRGDRGGRDGGSRHEGGGRRHSAPEFDVAAVGAIAAVIAGGGIVLARRRKS